MFSSPRSHLIWSILTSLAFAAQQSSLRAEQLTVAWDESSDPDVVAHAVYYGDVDGPTIYRVEALLPQSATVTGLVPGTTYFIYAVAVGSSGQESAPSNTVFYSVKHTAAPPEYAQPGTPPDTASPPEQPGNPPSTPSTDLTSSYLVSSQTYVTQAGQQYALSFDLLAFSMLTDSEQCSLEMIVRGQAVLLDQPIQVIVPPYGSSSGTQTVRFTADSASATVELNAGSSTMSSIRFTLENANLQ